MLRFNFLKFQSLDSCCCFQGLLNIYHNFTERKTHLSHFSARFDAEYLVYRKRKEKKIHFPSTREFLCGMSVC